LIVLESLPSPFSPALPSALEAERHTVLARLSQSLFENLSSEDYAWLLDKSAADAEFFRALCKVILCSEYALGQFCLRPQLLCELLGRDEQGRDDCRDNFHNVFSHDKTLAELRDEAAVLSADCDSDKALQFALRCLRRREMLRIIWRDLNRLCDLEQTTAALSNLAEVCLDAAERFHYQALCAAHGVPIGEDSGEPQRLVIIGMGKLGAAELNLSSDIDFIFAFAESGETDHPSQAISNQEFFIALGKRIIAAVDQRTEDGFVFRVDMRLRPNGGSGLLALSFSAMEYYYQQHGRDWERYALVKARPVAGDVQAGWQLLETLRPFVYRRYLDFGAIDALRDMKRLIVQQRRRQGLDGDLKLGAGGIREVEFFVQSFQLIYGGRDTAFQQRALLSVLEVLVSADCIDSQTAAALRAAYIFLRHSEHALQARRDEQTQRLPRDEINWQRLALALDYDSVAVYQSALSRHREIVAGAFLSVVSESEVAPDRAQAEGGDAEDSRLLHWQWLWQQIAVGAVEELPVAEAEVDQVERQLAEKLQRFRAMRKVQSLEKTACERLDRIFPAVMVLVEQQQEPVLALDRLLPFFESILRRTAYIALLLENRQALQQLVSLCAISPWISEQLSTYPALLDELLDRRALYRLPSHDSLSDELRQLLLRIEGDDLEQFMDMLRHFKLAHGLRVAACQLSGELTLMKMSDYLTFLAEVILQAALEFVWQELVARHGVPLREDGSPCAPDFIVVGYGKLGGLELGPASDLDLVFIHDSAAQGETVQAEAGSVSVSNAVFFNRLGQRLIHVLSAQTVSGALYEVDMRLRPSGASGFLVSSFAAFSQYQHSKAWTWEQQALVRARAVVGDADLQARFTALRTELLSRARDREALREEVVSMREKMRAHLGGDNKALDPALDSDGRFALKQGRGGMIDIEFLVQFLVLSHAHDHPQLLQWTDNVRLLATLADCSLLSPEESRQLIEAYTTFRSASHLAALQQLFDHVPLCEFDMHCRQVSALWQHYLGAAS